MKGGRGDDVPGAAMAVLHGAASQQLEPYRSGEDRSGTGEASQQPVGLRRFGIFAGLDCCCTEWWHSTCCVTSYR